MTMLEWLFEVHLTCASDLVLGGGFCQVLKFPPPVITGWSHLTRNMAEKMTKIQIPSYLYGAEARIGETLREERLPTGSVIEVKGHTRWLCIRLNIAPDLQKTNNCNAL